MASGSLQPGAEPLARGRSYSVFEALLGRDHQTAKERDGPFRLIRWLLEVTTNAALRAQVNIITTFAFIRAARQECVRLENAINGTLGQETPSVSFEGFKKTKEGISKLEDILLEEWEYTVEPNIFESKSVLECRKSVESWERNRAKVLDKFLRVSVLSPGGARPNPEALVQTLWEPRRDDALVLRTMVEHIEPERIIIDERLNQSRTILRSLMGLAERAQPVLNRERTTYAIKTAWFIRVAIEESKSVNTRYLRRRYLQGSDVWATALDLALSIAGDNVGMGEVARKYQTFVDKLLVNTDSTLSPQALLDLFAAGAHVSRPFMSQNHALVELCYELGQQYSSTGVGDLDKLEAVQDAISRCLDAANAARREQLHFEVYLVPKSIPSTPP
ncbi:hypothetical protein PIIN_00930 [Serendipita indica DSM 11827]|uniref:Uncharacterized protein n=1 Tax=Serendipita indica (strain DSM 11827) TaxID=1109443 RepID=G4T714_SERID|nr:hypothetical protein PIIN_00930 [Serendipita indica DSM 11827]